MPHRFPHFLVRSVRGRLVFLVATITLTALFLGLLLVGQSFRNERRAVERHLSATARALANGVDLQLGQYEALLKGLATFPSLNRGDIEAFDRAARAVVSGRDIWVVLADETGQQLINTRVPRGDLLPRSEVMPGVREAMKEGRTFISNVAIGEVAKGPVLFVAIPVQQGGRTLMLALVTVPSVFAEGIAVRNLAPNGTVAIIDRNGVVAARNRAPERFVGKQATGDLREAILRQSEGVLESVTLDGHSVLTAFCHSQSGWAVVNAVPKSEIYASTARLVTVALGLSGILLAVAVFLASWIGRAVVQGVGGLVRSTALVGKGEIPPVTESGLAEIDFVAGAIRKSAQQLVDRQKERDQAEEALRDETRVLELLNKTGVQIASQLDLQTLLQRVTDSATELSGAQFGAFFYTQKDDKGGVFTLYTLSGAPREAFEEFGHPRSTPIFAPTFEGKGIVRMDDVTKSPRYGTMSPHHGMPKGHLPVRSYLAVPVISRSGEVIGGLFFGHSDVGVFTERSERLVAGVAAQAAVAIDNA
ncbi:MAG: GAF domain-containing protein, partial [Limisphaerales bacterium]